MRTVTGLGLLAASAFGLLLSTGCGDDDDSGLAPGASTFTGNVTAANTSAAEPAGGWLTRFASLFGFAATAHAQNGDVTLDGIIVAIRGGGTESTSVTDANGQFRINRAPTGDVLAIFRRGNCEASLGLNFVPSRSSIVLSNVVFDCDSVSVAQIQESFEGVLREDPGVPGNNIGVCVRTGASDRTRGVNGDDADVDFANGNQGNYENLEGDDRVAIEGERNPSGDAADFDASRIVILERDVQDPCDDDPLT